ncbi:MAG: hypothetical protein C0177_04335 [Fervidicoccus fontis]|nr:MAG: hypothetical protein C0177_04335 [Fervidicoccus fontis]
MRQFLMILLLSCNLGFGFGFVTEDGSQSQQIRKVEFNPRQVMVNRLYQIVYASARSDIPYRFGGNSLNGMDCSAFVMDVYRMLGINLPRTAREQAQYGRYVYHHLEPGDLLFFQTYASYPSHVAIYLGNGYIAEASSTYHRVVIDNIYNQPYLLKHFLFAKRLF